MKRKNAVSVPEEGGMGPSRWVVFLLLAGVCLVLYYNSLHGQFVFDDSTLVQTDDRIQRLSNIPRLLNPFSSTYLTYRPVRTISYAVDYYFTKYDPFGYHLSNVIYHALSTWLVFLIGAQILAAWQPALLAALIFAVHPIHTEAVSYISGRRDVLSTLFFLLGFYLFIRYRASRRHVLLAGVVMAYILGVLSKEMAVTLPAVLFLFDWYREMTLHKEPGQRRGWPEIGSALSAVFRRHKFLYGSTVSIALFFVYYYLFITPASTNLRIYWGGSGYTTFLTTTKIFAKYLQLVFWPATLIADYNSGQVFPLAFQIADPTVLLSLALVLGAIAASVWALRFDLRPAFGGLFFFVTLLPVAHIIPHHELISEHFLYLPSVGFCFVVAWALQKLFVRPDLRPWAYTAAGLMLILLSWRTVVRNRDWADEFTLWTATLRDAPLSVRAYTNLGLVHLNRNELDQAIDHFEKSLAIPSKTELGTISRVRALQNMGVAYYRKGQYDKALDCYRQCAELEPKNFVSYLNMGVVYNKRHQNAEAIESYKKALAISPSSKEALLNLAIGYNIVKDYSKALETYQRLIEVDRGTELTGRAHYAMGMIYNYYLGDFQRAGYHFEEARKIDPIKYRTEAWLGKQINPEKIETPPEK